MALVNVPPFILAPPIFSSNTLTSTLLDASGEYESFYVVVPKTGNISRVHFRAGAKTSDGDGLRIRLETATETAPPAVPSGTLYGGMTEITIASVTASGWNRSGAAGTPAAATAGDRIFVKFLSPAGTTCNLNIASRPGNWNLNLTPGGIQSAYAVTNVTGSNVAAGTGFAIALEYDDGTVYMMPNCVPISALTTTSFNSGSTPDEVGNLIVMPYRCRVIGFVTGITLSTNDGAPDFVLYDSGGSVLLTKSWSENFSRQATAAPSVILCASEGGAIVDEGDSVRAIHKPSNTTNIARTVSTIDTSTGGTRIRSGMPGAAIMKLTTRVDAGAWTDTDDQFDSIGLIIDQVDGAPAAAPGLFGSPLRSPFIG